MCDRPLILEDSLDNHLVRFADHTAWQLTKKLSEKPWEGTALGKRREPDEDGEWQPSEAHAVYECLQVQGPRLGSVAIVKVRIEVPYDLPPSDDPEERAKEASGMRLNDYTVQEIETLKRLTAGKCSATPTLLAVKVDVQDKSSVLNSTGKPGFSSRWDDNVQWWMPGGYIVYILMNKLPAEPLNSNTYWRGQLFTPEDRNEVRSAFKKAYM
ncbi:MAG: hypothetical protein Q9207_005596 [Kuettlingeria erythrocarpa]